MGEKSHKSLERNLEALADVLHGEMHNFKEKILRTICNCITTQTEKMSIYSSLVGLLNAKKFEIGEEFVDMIVEDLKSALALKQFSKARQLVRFLADLVNAKVVASSSLMSLFDTLVTVVYEPNIPQVRSDWYVFVVLSSLPWVGRELQERKRSELERLFSALEQYMSKRTTPYLPAFQVWTSDHPHPQRDYLELLWTQVLKMRDSEWKEHVLMRPYVGFDAEIGAAYSHPLPTVNVPNHTEDCVYPLPSAIFRIFSNDDLTYVPQAGFLLPPTESIDRFLCEETVRCILSSHENNRKECTSALVAFADRLMEKVRLPADYVITEVLFGHIFHLPCPPQVAVYYSSLLIELCKKNAEVFPQILTQTTKLLFNRLDKMNFVCINRFACWFAYHLSNYKFQWEWDSWSANLQGPSALTCNLFLTEVFTRCIRLGCYEDFAELVEDPFSKLLPPEPMPQFKYREDTSSPEAVVANELLEAIKAKEKVEKMAPILDKIGVSDPDLDLDSDKVLKSKVELLTHCILHIGSKTISHCFLALFKFRALFVDLTTCDSSHMTCLQSVADFYCNNTQLHTLVVDKLVRMQIVDALSVVSWVFTPSTVPQLSKQYIWDILASAVQKTNKAYLHVNKELANTREKLKQVSHLDEVAMGEELSKELEGRIEELEESAEESERAQRDIFVLLCQSLVSVLTEHLARCDQEGVDYESVWFLCTLDNCRQLLVENYRELQKYASSLESLAFTADVDSRILEVFQQFQSLL